ncbi:dihydrofolate reductase [Lactobacillaceae bacterium L1_55_11]|nr:dihydrofolate reductase [Lactobacillaceae bacterium L1_55_11]
MKTIRMVWAQDDRGAIGKDGTLPWHIPADLAVFKAETINSLMIMGRNTWAAIGRPLPKRQTVVLTRQADFDPGFPEVKVVHSLREALALIEASPTDLVSIAGGAKIYQEFMPYATELVVTRVAGDYQGDTFMPPIDTQVFALVDQKPGSDHGYQFEVQRYQRILEKGVNKDGKH